MSHLPTPSATVSQVTPDTLVLAGRWTAREIGTVPEQIDALSAAATATIHIDGAGIEALDTAGAWVLHKLLRQLGGRDAALPVHNLRPEFAKRFEAIHQQADDHQDSPPATPSPSRLEELGKATEHIGKEIAALLRFVGECAVAMLGCFAHPARWRWRPILFNLRSAGFDALPIVGVLSFLLGVVVAYQGADQLRQYGANIFVADLVGLSMLREFAPLITAIIIAGRSGSAYAAQIGTMSVTEEIDALRTLGIAPQELLVLPKILALLIALPLLTVFADLLGVLGGMVMARAQLGVGFAEFLERFVKAVSVTAYLTGIGKAPVFAVIIAVVGCFQGFRTRGGADSVGRQTTRSVVQSIFLVIVADGLFSVAFSALDL